MPVAMRNAAIAHASHNAGFHYRILKEVRDAGSMHLDDLGSRFGHVGDVVDAVDWLADRGLVALDDTDIWIR